MVYRRFSLLGKPEIRYLPSFGTLSPGAFRGVSGEATPRVFNGLKALKAVSKGV
jgi:hypothetical protein